MTNTLYDGSIYPYMITHLLDLIYPHICLVCKTRLAEEGLCQNCLGNIRRVNGAVNQIRYEKTGIYYKRVYSAALYEGVLKEAIQLFKYKSRLSLGKLFSKLLIEFAETNLDMKQFDLIAPVPLHSVKLREREFNKAKILAGPLAARFGIRLSTGSLERAKATPPQSNLKKNERLQNPKGVFCVRNPRLFYKKRILLIDDVFTTGATTNECAKILLSSGAKSVSVLTLARGE